MYFISFQKHVRFLKVFERSLLSSPRLRLFDQNYSKNCNIVKYYYNLK